MSNVTRTVSDGIAHVRLDRPDKLNALTLDILEDLVAVAHELRRDKDLRAVVVSGEGDAFCAGLDFASVLSSPAGIAKAFVPRPWRGTNTFQEAPWAFRRIPVPVIAAVHGHCLGGGLQIALAADFRIATPDSRWSVLEGKWGLIPDMSGIQALSELVGIDQAKLLTMTAEVFDGSRAAELGLVTRLEADPLAGAMRLAEELAGKSPDALAAAKRLFNGTWHAPARRTFSRERIEQAILLAARNTKVARQAAFKKSEPVYGPRVR
ncbi:crotonase/enoyl-CoA hydratase family protein [Nocardioides sp. zg-536]|uniref:Crotonase/enoyl-CoA hydratase family protein n=1 Tax=Nocardioides faecalis TaxID=2803858 RepID=A0A938Y3I6_9ACTN|nr:crotonase/enoyl-CoA hydratase family protein [Nocardioides faecalis]MBM9458570.1 crotonase/enoyl-CoA hydratase family protein [Nocardioides faecalis]MBS4752901.1 crotonase/enoyl-CoA hydratase family protein [Nocardioides faecalis]QVI58572.1 crotonase/enoyl-CoA hydratase family protein [Nocardioides faecalis]